MAETGNRENSRERILDVAEALFREHGLHAVSLGDVASSAGIQKSSLYHHFSHGKEELYVAVHDRMFGRIGDALDKRLNSAVTTVPREANLLEYGLHIATDWFLSQPPVFILAMMLHDMPDLSDQSRERLTRSSYGVLMRPIVSLVASARERGDVRDVDAHTIAGGFLSILEGSIIAHRAGFGTDLPGMMRSSVEMIVHGVKETET